MLTIDIWHTIIRQLLTLINWDSYSNNTWMNYPSYIQLCMWGHWGRNLRQL